MPLALILQLASSFRPDPSQTKPEEPKSKLRWLVPSPPLLRIVLVFVIPALLSTLAIQVMQGNNVFFLNYFSILSFQAGDVVTSLAWLK